ncbi:MAG TPA: triple tyrosine motif-containing protein, partial [Verrucomicrobiota bacterium]|nr:triple tyrosine motif-containing protein [Verrucomicrobiota bacterium]
VWAANQGGVFRRDGGAGFVEIKDASGRPVRHVTCLLGDAAGALWLGTADRGLLRWHDGTLATLDARAGFPVTTVQSLIADGRGFLWLTSGRHLVRARWSSLDLAADGRGGRVECQMFDASDGLPSAEFTAGRQPAATRDARGRLWFATTKGVAMADPANLRLNDLPPPVHVEAIAYVRPDPERGGEIQVRRRGPFTGPETLPAGSGRLEIEYAGLSFVAPGRVQFQVKLEGRDQDWRDVGSRRSAYFHELPPGRHVFRVRAANNDGVWNETGASLALTLLPHFWQTPWFWSGAASLLVGAGALSVWWGTRARVRRAEERARAAGEIRDLAGRLIHAQEDERRRLARELHDDFSQ